MQTNNGGVNSAFGALARGSNTTGIGNTALGGALLCHSESNNGVGAGAGANQTTGSDNIYLMSQGVAAESGQIKIGVLGLHTQATMIGIHGNTSSGGIGVLVNANGTLGTTTSSARFKQDVRDMGSDSHVLLKLRPRDFPLPRGRRGRR